MSLLSGLLGPGLTAATQIAGGYQNAQANAATEQQKAIVQQIALLRQQHEDEISNALKQSQTNLERHIVRAPIDGEVLKMNLRLGEFAQAGMMKDPLLMLGNITPLHVRVDIDENDAWRFKPGAKAEGALRGNRDIKSPLAFVRAEPYVLPKKSLTGDSSERVDTRVLQVIFRVENETLPVYVGQLMDVFIEAADAPAGSAAAPKAP